MARCSCAKAMPFAPRRSTVICGQPSRINGSTGLCSGPVRKSPWPVLPETGEVVHVADLREDEGYRSGDQLAVAAVDVASIRTMLIVPMLKDDELIGTFNIFRTEVSLFSEKQIELVTNFASQAVIAIENTRLLNELSQSLQYQTAINSVLNVISRSPSDVQPVLETIAETAQRLCQAEQVYILTLDKGRFRLVAAKDAQVSRVKFLRENPIELNRGSVVGRVAMDGRAVHIADAKVDPEYSLNMAGESRGYRTILGIPLFRDGVVIGVIVLTRSIVQPIPISRLSW